MAILTDIQGLLTDARSRLSQVGIELGTFAQENPIITGVSLVAAGTGLGVAGSKLYSVAKKKKSKSKSSKSKRKRKSYRHSKKGRSTPRTAGKGKDRSTKRIRYTKNRQPYIILKSGKARFIKKSSARQSHKRKGGRY
jgi:hypothetical protein